MVSNGETNSENLHLISCCCCFSISILTWEVGWAHLDMPLCDSVMLLVSSYVLDALM